MITFYKATRKYWGWRLYKPTNILSKDWKFGLIECYAAKLMKHIKSIEISQKLKIFLFECFKLFPIFNCVPYAND